MSRPDPSTGSLHLSGLPFERGRTLGRSRKDRIHVFLNDGLARLNHVAPSPIDPARLAADLDQYGAAIAASLPDIWAEIEGLVDGADIPLDQAVLLQCRREIMGYARFPAGGDCTSLAVSAPHHPMLAQTVDLTCEMADHIEMLRITGADIAGGGAWVFSFTGLLGYLGVNDAGLAVGLNLVLGGEWTPGVPPYLAIRHLINTASTVEEAIDILRGLPLASSRNFVLCDANRAVSVETLKDDLRILEGPVVAHTNSYLHPDFESRDEMNVFSRNSSRARLRAMEQGWSDMSKATPEKGLFAVMSGAPINVTGPYDLRREKTVASVVMDPCSGTLLLRRGDPAKATTERHSGHKQTVSA